MSANITELSSATFKSAIASGTVLVDFWAPWCGPCKAIAPVLEDLAKDLAGKLNVAKVDVDANRDLAMEYGVRSIPTFLVFKDGQLAEKIVGVGGITTKAAFAAKIQPHLS